MNNWFDQLLVWDVALAPNEYMKFGTKDMLVESVFGWGKHCCRKLSQMKGLKLILDTDVLFWRLLAVSVIHDVDMRKVLHHQLVAVPPSLFHALQ